MKVSIFDNWLHASRKGNGCVYRNENKMKVEKESWGWEQQGRYTYTTGAEATGCSRCECWVFPPIFSNQCHVVLIVLLLGSLFFPASVFFVSVNASRIAQLGSECHTQFCLAGIMIPLRQPLRPLLTVPTNHGQIACACDIYSSSIHLNQIGFAATLWWEWEEGLWSCSRAVIEMISAQLMESRCSIDVVAYFYKAKEGFLFDWNT